MASVGFFMLAGRLFNAGKITMMNIRSCVPRPPGVLLNMNSLLMSSKTKSRVMQLYNIDDSLTVVDTINANSRFDFSDCLCVNTRPLTKQTVK